MTNRKSRPLYARRKYRKAWHFRPECPEWPAKRAPDYLVIVQVTPPDGPFCEHCEKIERRHRPGPIFSK